MKAGSTLGSTFILNNQNALSFARNIANANKERIGIFDKDGNLIYGNPRGGASSVNAPAFITGYTVHNHPNGNPQASTQDLEALNHDKESGIVSKDYITGDTFMYLMKRTTSEPINAKVIHDEALAKMNSLLSNPKYKRTSSQLIYAAQKEIFGNME